ncbi:MAG: hypothetical protein ACK53X_06675, partial [Holosporales bacterium]
MPPAAIAANPGGHRAGRLGLSRGFVSDGQLQQAHRRFGMGGNAVFEDRLAKIMERTTLKTAGYQSLTPPEWAAILQARYGGVE